ncbi:polymerase [Pongola virus - SAAr1]|uniref:RNA-directed RNA polymerase L n=1 Tax=Pongola virus - SAAr1 TaxID=537994 RepID=A0A088MSK9_9VIRU|nr:polymerase [Pongola virus - SAAr1]
MDNEAIEEFRRRIRRAKDACTAKEINSDLLEARHDYFGVEYCKSIDIPYRNNVFFSDIILDLYPDINPVEIRFPNITPDNFIYVNNILFLLDYKVSVSNEYAQITYNKYYELTREVSIELGLRIEIVIIRCDPITKNIYINNDTFRDLFPNNPDNLNFNWYFDLRQILFDKFGDDDEFLLKVAHGDFTLTAPWCKDGCKDYLKHPIYKEFKYSMPIPERRLFEDSMKFSAYESERWNTQLLKIKSHTETSYKEYISTEARNIFLVDEKYPQPNRDEIQTGWDLMSKRIGEEREISSNYADQKPSIHFIWCENNSEYPTQSTQKLVYLSKCLMSLEGQSSYSSAFRSIGRMMNIEENYQTYEVFCNERKMKARSTWKQVTNQKLEPKLIGEALVLWEQQFILNSDKIQKNDKRSLIKEFYGIGGHKAFKDKTEVDMSNNKPKILDFNDDMIKFKSIDMVNKVKTILSNEICYQKDHFIKTHFGHEIESANPETMENISHIFKTQFWAAINDISILMKNILSVSQYNRHNTFRIATCANNSIFAIVMPSADIKTKKATVVFNIIALHKKEDNVINPGVLHGTFKCKHGNNYISISKAVRLDKERCQRIVSSPGLFLLTVLLFKQGNETINMDDVMVFSFFTSLSVTKSMLSLTEPSRYMIMNSLAISSNVKDYIAEKFSPYTKTLFSVYMTNLIKTACFDAYMQRSKIQLRDIFLSDYDITQKGIKDNRNIKSIWFPGSVTLKEYLNQIYMPFYFNAKGLHEKHHVMIDLAKTILEIEKDQRKEITAIWSNQPKKQTVNLSILIHAIAKNLLVDTSRHNHLRNRIENRNNFRRSISTISTFTSSKSCIKVGDFREIKEKQSERIQKINKSNMVKYRVANQQFVSEFDNNLEVKHCDYKMMRQAIPNYVDHISTKVFDRLYELFKTNKLTDRPCIEEIMDIMTTHTDFYFSFFNKGQKTAKDREIFVGEFEAKMCMYAVERIAKERCRLNPEEMISEPGDGKLRVLEQKSEQEIRYLVEHTRQRNREIEEEIMNLVEDNIDKNIDKLEILQTSRHRGLKIEINADMSKWSAQDVFYKYFWLIAMDPILYPQEKERIIFFFCNYMQKKLILPDELLYNILDQKKQYKDDIISEMTNQLSHNYVEIKRNWLQGNFNYTSSYVHTCAMSVYKDIVKAMAELLDTEAVVNSLVHSDDNQTSITLTQNKLPDDNIINFSIIEFERVCLTFGCQANMKKTYLTNFIKEFVSLFNLYGEPFSIYGRFLLTAVGDCGYLGPYEDLSSRISSAQTALKHGCPPSLVWVGIAVSHWITYLTYNCLPGQVNDPLNYLPVEERVDIPIELNGYLKAPLPLISILGMEAGNVSFLLDLLRKYTPVMKKRETVLVQCMEIPNWDLNQLTETEIFKLKILRYLVLDGEMDSSDIMGETSEMRGRSILTPRKFTTAGSLRKLLSFNDFQCLQQEANGLEGLFLYMLDKPELLVTKGENANDFMNSILYRYNSKRFKESLSIQNPAQLFIEQILFSNKPVIDFTGIREKYLNFNDSIKQETSTQIIGRVTFCEAYRMLARDISSLKLDSDDISTIYSFIILNDPMIIAACNMQILSVIGSPQDRLGMSCSTMPEFRNLKTTINSPALILRAYSKSTPDILGVDATEMSRDLIHLEEFIKATKLKEKMEMRIKENEVLQNKRDLIFELKEITRFYQVCYEYVKSTEHKIKIFILPSKAYTTTDFCSLIQGNLVKDKQWFTIHYLKQIISNSTKAIVQTLPTTELNISAECFKLICHFADTFLDITSRIPFIRKIIDNFSYKNIPVKNLYDNLLHSNLRTEFIPLLFRLESLTQHDLDRYDASKSQERIAWNDWQCTRFLDTGPINLSITGNNRAITILGEDNELTYSELQLSKVYPDNIIRSGRKLLNTRHGLKIENMKKIETYPGTYYITYQKIDKTRYLYQVHTHEAIIRKNEEMYRNQLKAYHEIVPVCPVNVAEVESSQRIWLRNMDILNNDNFFVSKVKITPEEFATIKRCHFSKMLSFEGPDLNTGIINISGLMKSAELLSLTYDNIVGGSLVSLSKIIQCSGNTTLSEGLEFLSDDPMEYTEGETINATPLFNIYYNKKGYKHMTFKNAINELIERETNRFQSLFVFSGDNFYSKENLGCLESIISLVRILKTNEWSSIMENCIHICMIKSNMDHVYHMFDTPTYFLKNPITHEINWYNYLEFIERIPDPNDATWGDIFKNFKSKCRDLILKEIRSGQDFSNIAAMLARDEGRGLLDFFDE